MNRYFKAVGRRVHFFVTKSLADVDTTEIHTCENPHDAAVLALDLNKCISNYEQGRKGEKQT